MKVTEVIVSAGRTFNHPFEQYSNLKPHVTLKATLDETDDVDACTKALQAKAEGVIEDHKTLMLEQIKRLYRLAQDEQRMQSLERQIVNAQQELKEIREGKRLLEPPTEDDEPERMDDSDSYGPRSRQF